MVILMLYPSFPPFATATAACLLLAGCRLGLT